MDRKQSVCLGTVRRNSTSLERVTSKYVAWFASVVVLCLFSSNMYAKGEAAATRAPLLSSPPKETIVNTGESVVFKWRIILGHKDFHQLENISFGFGVDGQISRNLITVKAVRGENHTTHFIINTTRGYDKRLRWIGRTGRVVFEMVNVTKEDTNIYVMRMSFGTRRDPIVDSIGLVVNFPPLIINRSPLLKQVRLPEGESVDVMCDVISCPRAKVTWFKDGQAVQNDTKKHPLTLRHAQLSQTGIYECVATNKLGSDRNHVLVIVTSCPLDEHRKKNGPRASTNYEGHSPDALISMIAPAAVFVVIFSAYLFFKCPATRYKNRTERNTYRNSKGTSTNDEQTTNLLAEWSQFNDRGEKI